MHYTVMSERETLVRVDAQPGGPTAEGERNKRNGWREGRSEQGGRMRGG